MRYNTPEAALSAAISNIGDIHNCIVDYIYDECLSDHSNRTVYEKHIRVVLGMFGHCYNKAQRKYWLMRGWSTTETEYQYKIYSGWCDTGSLKHHISKYGPIEGPLKYEERNNNTSHRNTLEGQISIHGYEEGTRRYNEKCDKMSESSTKESYILKYGEKSYEENVVRRKTSNINYYLDQGLTLDEAKMMLSERQSTFSLDKCISKYGDSGEEIWRNRQIKWQNTLNSKPQDEIDAFNKLKDSQSLESFIRRFGEIDGPVKRTEYFDGVALSRFIDKFGEINGPIEYQKHKEIKSRSGGGAASKESLKIFVPLYEYLLDNGISADDIKWGVEGSKEYSISRFRYDFTILSMCVIIEYHGIHWHPKSPDDVVWKGLYRPDKCDYKCDEKWYYDRHKKQVAEDAGFTVIEVWSDETFDLIEMVGDIMDDEYVE